WTGFDQRHQFGGIFALAQRDAVRVLLPGCANRVAVTEEAFVAVDEFGHFLIDVVAAPGFGVERLFVCLIVLAADRKFAEAQETKCKNERENQQLRKMVMGTHEFAFKGLAPKSQPVAKQSPAIQDRLR